MGNKPSRFAVSWRFGLIGVFLYKKLHTKNSWEEKGYIFTRFMGTFFIIFALLLTALFLVFNGSTTYSLLLILIGLVFLCSLAYGYWAESFFQKYINR